MRGGKPTVFVPYPLAAEDHQTSNAMNLVNKQAALIVKDNEGKRKTGVNCYQPCQKMNVTANIETNIHVIGHHQCR
jgi:UDP-N-acetylglucosamine--N-acetylmuramyl-(pentapeptide) pyrophosphoryl-undecaprenol N-acetylglucosamine transferase